MIAYLKLFWSAAITKLTTYAALVTGTIAMLPELISDYWGQLEGAVPHLKVYHGTVTAIGIIVTIWARVRRQLHPQP